MAKSKTDKSVLALQKKLEGKSNPPKVKRKLFSQAYRNKFDKIQLLAGGVVQHQNPVSIKEFLTLTFFFHDHGSLRWPDLKEKFSFYQSLNQPAAKQKLLVKMVQLVLGMAAEANTIRSAMESKC